MIILGIHIDTRCNQNCPFMYVNHKNICPACKHFVPVYFPTILKELYKLKEKAEHQGKVIVSAIVKDDKIINIYSEVI